MRNSRKPLSPLRLKRKRRGAGRGSVPNYRREKYIGHQLFWESDSSAYVAVTTAGGMTPLAVGDDGGGNGCGWREQCIP